MNNINQRDTQNGKELILRRVTKADTGEYTIRSEDVTGTFTIVVMTIPTITISGDRTVLQGGIVDLTCFADGHPAPQVHWTRNGNTITNQSRLTISAATTEDSGEYECIGVNSHRTTSKKVLVEVRIVLERFLS